MVSRNLAIITKLTQYPDQRFLMLREEKGKSGYADMVWVSQLFLEYKQQ